MLAAKIHSLAGSYALAWAPSDEQWASLCRLSAFRLPFWACPLAREFKTALEIY
jgi:hypothetical protein